MRNLLFLSGMILALSLGSCALTPSDYNTAIMNQVVGVENEAANITKLLQERDFDGAQTALATGQERVKSALDRLEKMSAFRGDDALRQAAISFVSFYDRIFSNEYQESLDLLKRGGPFSMDESDHLFEILQSISNEGIEVKENFIAENLAFIERYGLIVQRRP